MTSRRLALFLVLALAVATAAWLLWPDAPAPGAGAEAPLPKQDSGPSAREVAVTEPSVGEESADAGVVTTLRVVSAIDHRPLPGAEVEVTRSLGGHGLIIMHHPPRPVGEGLTDANGTVRFSDLPEEGPLSASIHCPFFEIVTVNFVRNGTVELEPLQPLRGLVLNADRTPAPGARVFTQGESPLQTTAGPDGHFTLGWAAWGYVVGEKNGALGVGVSLDRQDAFSVEIVLGAAPLRTSRVVGRDGSPLEGVDVEMRIGPVTQHQLTGGDGAWSAPALADVHAAVRFQKQGYVPAEEKGDLGSPWKDTVLSHGARLEGRVVKPDQSPVAGATIEIAGMAPDRRPPLVTTDAQGRFAFAGLGQAAVVVWATLGEETAHVEVDLPDGRPHQVTVVLGPEAVPVELEVVNENGTEVDTWSAVATPLPDPGWNIRREIVGDLELHARPLSSRRHLLRCAQRGGHRGREREA